MAALAWAAGILFIIGHGLYRYLRFLRRLRVVEQPDEGWSAAWNDLLLHGVRRPIPLRVLRDVGPALCLLPSGYQLVVPAGIAARLSSRQRRRFSAMSWPTTNTAICGSWSWCGCWPCRTGSIRSLGGRCGITTNAPSGCATEWPAAARRRRSTTPMPCWSSARCVSCRFLTRAPTGRPAVQSHPPLGCQTVSRGLEVEDGRFSCFGIQSGGRGRDTD